MSQFSTNEAVSLEKQVDNLKPIKHIQAENFDDYYEINKCVSWIQSNDYKTVCLQFPDYLLNDSTTIALKLQEKLKETVYILGDTAYESCCLDYVAAAHINADALIHFGVRCFSKCANDIPSLFIYEKFDFDVEKFEESFKNWFIDYNTMKICVVIDYPYISYQEELIKKLHKYPIQINLIEDDLSDFEILIYVGELGRKIYHFNCLNAHAKLHYFDTQTSKINQYEINARILKRRLYLCELIKDSNTIGIIIGTLAVKNYLKVIDRLKKLLEVNGKKYYLITVGKPTVAKLANFPEMDLYVLISCAMNELYESRDFFKPIVTPFDVEMALNPNANQQQFSYDFNTYLPIDDDLNDLKSALNQSDVSLITGKMRMSQLDHVELAGNSKIAIKNNALAVNQHGGAGFLGGRSWQGLEQNLGQTEVKLAENGRVGIAANYKNEIN